MRQKCTTILKVSVALILALMMVVGSISTVVAATITIEQSESTTDSTAADNKAADVADDSADAPAQSVPLTDKLVRLVKDDIAGTGAAVDVAPTGYDEWYVKGNWDMNGEEWVLHDISGTGYEVTLNGGTDYSFVFVANRDQFTATNCVITRTTDYNFSNKNKEENMTLRTTIAGKYKFIYKSMSGGDTSMSVRIEFPEDTTPDTWTVVGGSAGNTNGGQSDPLFTSTWDTTLNQNDMTNTSGTTWTWTKNNVTLNAGKILCKVVKNHSWNNAYPSSNQSYNIATAGTYNVTITFNSSTKDVTITATQITKSTLTVQDNIDHATVKATYNGTTVGEGQSISNVPQGASVSISVTPASGYKCTGVTGTYNTNSTVSGTGSGNSWTLAMPAANTTVSVTLGTVTMKKIYFNNNYTLYGTVYAYVYDLDTDGTTHTYEYLGKRPGKVMTEPENSEIWYIEVPQDVDYVEFISGDGKTTGEMEIPWKNGATGYDYPKYTAPYGHNDAPNTTNGGTWGNYIYGSDNKRTNEYTVSDGTTMSASNLFTGLTATMYDYYTDGEITASAGTASDTGASGAPNGWIGGIASDEYSKGTTGSGWKWNPYTTLNYELSAYANNSSQPKYNVTTPLYFGNLNTKNMSSEHKAVVEAYHNWNLDANNSIDLDPNSTAITGLSGKTLANDTIHYYSASDTANQNGAPMAMFNEDFLSGENNQNKALATILRTSSFPVRKTVENGTLTGVNKLYLNPAQWANDGCVFDAYFWGGSETSWVPFPDSGNKRAVDIPSWATSVVFVRRLSSTGHQTTWDPKERQSEDITLSKTGTGAKNVYTFDNNWNNAKSSFTASLDTSLDGCTFTGGHDYYEFDSTDGKDNAYITNIDKTDKTANIDYYFDDAVWSGGTRNNTRGFFPFDYANKGNVAHDLGFGMKLTIPFTLKGNDTNNGVNTDGTDQEFRFSGDDDLWVFVDGKLVLDLGGAHAKTTGSINFHDKTVSADHQQAIASGVDRNGSFATGFNTNENYVHTMTIYYMERGMFESNLKFGFSFHAIPNQFWIDKKIRTKDIINAGFYTSNGQSGSASNQDDTLTQREGRFISKFEASYQNEAFTVTHKYGSSAADATTPAANKTYTIDNDTNSYTTPSEGTYPIKHDLGNAFIGQFTTGQYFNLKETFGNNNKYVYTPVFSVWDQANNNQALPYPSGSSYGDNTSGYTFQFNPTTTVQTAIENTNIKARFENYMVAHTLTLKKEITNATDTTTPFTIQVMFDFENDGNYIAYPLHCDVDGERTQLSNTGTIDITAGQILEIEEIPQNAKIQVKEVLDDTVSGYRYNGMTLKEGSTTIQPAASVEKGIQFVMLSSDISVDIANKKPDNKYTITYKYKSYDNLYGYQNYTVSGVFTKNELDTYMTLTSEGNLAFRSVTLKKTFVNTKAPYEDNFHETLSFADSDISDTGTDSINGSDVTLGWDAEGNYTCTVTAAESVDNTINVYFSLPYDVEIDETSPNYLTAKADSYNYVKQIDNVARGSKRINCFDWYVTSGVPKMNESWTPEKTTFVKAPLMIYVDNNDSDGYDEGETIQYFQYWKVMKQSEYANNEPVEYTRCYDYEFNLSLFMDCIIEPVYGASWGQSDGNPNPPSSYNDYDRFDPELQINAASGKKISVTFLENSRNQYNQGGKGSRDGADAMDVIYSDFLLSFNSDPGTQLNAIDDTSSKKAGIVIEAVDYLEGDNTNGFNGSKDYSSDSNYTANQDDRKAAIKDWLTSGNNKPTGVAKSEFTVDALDNKNCIQYYYSIKNRNCNEDTDELIDTSQNRYKVYRAYAYIGDVNGSGLENVEISEPVYFTIYDIGKMYDLADHATNVTP